MRIALPLLIAFSLGSLAAAPEDASLASPSMGEEAFGNDPVENNAEWAKGVLAVANDKSRVYWRWINGNEEFFFKGSTLANLPNQLQAALTLFAQIEADRHEVVLLPTAGETQSFEKIHVSYDWSLAAPSGIYLSMIRRDQADLDLDPTTARMTLHLDGKRLRFDQLTLPPGVTLVGPADLAERYRLGLESEKPSVRARAAYLAWSIGYEPSIAPMLWKGGQHADANTRSVCQEGLKRCGARALKLMPEILRVAQVTKNEKLPQELSDLGEALLKLEPEEQPAKDLEQRRSALEQVLQKRRALSKSKGDDDQENSDGKSEEKDSKG